MTVEPMRMSKDAPAWQRLAYAVELIRDVMGEAGGPGEAVAVHVQSVADWQYLRRAVLMSATFARTVDGEIVYVEPGIGNVLEIHGTRFFPPETKPVWR